MGCLLSCEDPERHNVLAEYNPMILGDRVEQSSPTMYTEKLVKYTTSYIQPVVNTMIRGVRSTYNPSPPEGVDQNGEMLI